MTAIETIGVIAWIAYCITGLFVLAESGIYGIENTWKGTLVALFWWVYLVLKHRK